MKLIDSKGRIFGKLSIIDMLIILILAVLLIGIFVRSFVLETTATNTPDITFHYKAKISSVSDRIVDEFQVGDAIYNDASGEFYGTIVDVEVTDAVVWVANSEGQQVQTTYPDKSDVYITVEATGIVSDGRYLISRANEIEPNYQCYMYSKYIRFFFSIMEIY